MYLLSVLIEWRLQGDLLQQPTGGDMFPSVSITSTSLQLDEVPSLGQYSFLYLSDKPKDPSCFINIIDELYIYLNKRKIKKKRND